jgi:hypothetical protein
VRDYVDTKAGFRVLASRWLPRCDDLLPEGIVCQNLKLAAQVVHWFCLRGDGCVVKADIGENGIGNVLHPGDCISAEDVQPTLEGNPFLSRDWVTVEKYIHSTEWISPSLEMFVPPLGQGKPELTYISNQVFLRFGDFCGVTVSKDLLEAPWSEDLLASGKRIAAGLQSLGYVGHFDMDAVVDDENRIYLLEVNSRRTGGTHVHEFGQFAFGPDYLNQVALLSHDALKSGSIDNFADLLRVVGDLGYPMNGAKKGIVITVTSALTAGEFGCIAIGATTEEAVRLQQELIQRLPS